MNNNPFQKWSDHTHWSWLIIISAKATFTRGWTNFWPCSNPSGSSIHAVKMDKNLTASTRHTRKLDEFLHGLKLVRSRVNVAYFYRNIRRPCIREIDCGTYFWRIHYYCTPSLRSAAAFFSPTFHVDHFHGNDKWLCPLHENSSNLWPLAPRHVDSRQFLSNILKNSQSYSLFMNETKAHRSNFIFPFSWSIAVRLHAPNTPSAMRGLLMSMTKFLFYTSFQ